MHTAAVVVPVTLIAGFLGDSFDKSTFDLRDKTVLQLSRDVDRVRIEAPGQAEISIARVDNEWQLTAPLEARVQDLLSRLTAAEKVSQLTTGNGVNGGTTNNALVNWSIPAYDWWSEGTHGVKGSYNAPPHTDFPFPITTAMAFNR